jgi:predicted MPP superfamily phosphohydrolase
MTTAIGIAGGLSGVADATLIEPQRLSLERITIKLPGLPPALDGLRIAALGDFHLEPFTKLPLIQNSVELANGLRPDLTVLLGDYVDSTVDAIYDLAPALAALNARLGVFGILGNHDHWKGAAIVQGAMQAAGIPILKNSGITLASAGSSFLLAGLDSAWAGHPDIDAALSRSREGVPTIALMHEPDFADTLCKDPRVALQISGHTHGGQIRVPMVGALRLPRWGRLYQQGLYQLDRMKLYTNRGIGLVGVPVRFNCPPEVTEITLTHV